VLDWRQTQLELEEAKLQQAMAALLQLDRLRADVEAEAIRAEAELRASPLVSGHDLAALGGFRLRVKGREHEIDQRRDQGRNHVAEQQVRMLEARRRARLLDARGSGVRPNDSRLNRASSNRWHRNPTWRSGTPAADIAARRV